MSTSEGSALGVSQKLMSAYSRVRYGQPEHLLKGERPIPELEEGRLLVRVAATSVNPAEWHLVTGTPMLVRLTEGLRRPKSPLIGSDFAGTVVAIGPGVVGHAIGDEVFGAAPGAFAEYVSARQDLAIPKPDGVSFGEAASVGIAGLTALQALRDHGKLESGQRVLINGASGGVGTMAVQIAKALGAEVTGVCRRRNVEMVRRIGADQVIDYTHENYLELEGEFDLVVDNVGNNTFLANRSILKDGGRYVMVSGPKSKWLGPVRRMLWSMVTAIFVPEKFVWFVASNEHEDLQFLAELLTSGALRPEIESSHSFDEVPGVLSEVGEGHARAKLIVEMESQ